MTQLTYPEVNVLERSDADWNRLIRFGGYVSWVLLAALIAMYGVLGMVGGVPETAEGYYQTLQNDGFVGVLRLDFSTVILLSLFPFVAVAIYGALRKTRPAYGLLALVLILFGTLLGLANESAFSLMYLSDRHAAVTDVAQQEQFIMAGEAIIAGNMWHTTAGFLAGLFMQGAFVFISFVMLQTKEFSKWTAYTGMLSNGLDFLHVIIALFAPAVAAITLSIGGIFYLVWFILLGWDLVKLGRRVESV